MNLIRVSSLLITTIAIDDELGAVDENTTHTSMTFLHAKI